MKKCALITTINHNIGDDFVREGIVYLLGKVLGEKLLFTNIHKHCPITTRYGFEWLRNNRYGRRLDWLLPVGATRDKILEADLVVQCGAPVYWCHEPGPHCSKNEWYRPLIERRLLRRKPPRTSFLSLAGGSCQKYDSDGTEFLRCYDDTDYIRRFYEATTLTTVRDKLAKRILDSFGLDAALLPCTAIYAADSLGISAKQGEYVVLNFMPMGGHYLFGQKISPEQWERAITGFYFNIKNDYRVVFSCHNMAEFRAAKKIDASAECFISDNYKDYVVFYSKAIVGVVNRVHAGMIMAGLGKPSFVVGSDSRAQMAEEMGLACSFVGHTTEELLFAKFQIICNQLDEFKLRSINIKEEALQRYGGLIKDALAMPW